MGGEETYYLAIDLGGRVRCTGFSTELLDQDLPFLSQILDNSLLVSIHPARDQMHHEVKW